MLVQTPSFINDIAAIAEIEKELGDMQTETNNGFREYNVKINGSRIKILVGSLLPLNSNIIIENRKLKTVQCIINIGSNK